MTQPTPVHGFEPVQPSFGRVYYYHGDHLNSSTYATDNNGRPVTYYDYLPFGEVAVEHNQTTNFNNGYKFNAKELDEATGMSYYGARYYDPRISVFVSVDPLAEEFRNFSPYIYTLNNPIRFIDPDGRKPEDWLLLSGDKVFWYGGNYGDKSNLKYTFRATSGMIDVEVTRKGIKTIESLQVSKYQYVKNLGPTVEGRYKINLVPDPNRVASADLNTGELLRNPNGGIERIPDFIENPNRPGYGWTYQDWGQNRARLEPVKVTQPKDENGVVNKRDLYSFYIHDSKKGYSHGCHEVETELFDRLIEYRQEGNFYIDVKVEYPTKNHITNGGTEQN